MNAFIEATKWPMGFEPDDTTSLLQCTIVNERTSVGTSVGPELRVTCSTFRIAAVVQKAGAIQNSADARQEYCS